QRARRNSVDGQVEFAFKHLLLRDVEYGHIPRSERAAKHLRTAEWIESLGRPEDQAEMVAHHYVNALELSRAAGHDVGELAARTCAALREAGERAMSLNAVGQAVRYFSEALALASDQERAALLLRLGQAKHFESYSGGVELEEARQRFVAGDDPESAAEAALYLADIGWNAGDGDRSIAWLDDARALVAGRAPSRVQASVLSEASRYDMLGDRNESAIANGREALRMAEALGLDDIRTRALNNVGAARSATGDPRGVDDLDESIALASRLNLTADLIRGYNNRGTMKWLLGRPVEARRDVEEAYRLAQHFGHLGFAHWEEGGPLVG